MDHSFNCPQCGYPVPKNIKYAKLIVCSSCSSVLILESEALQFAGKRSVLVDYPSIFRVGGHYRYRNMDFFIQGRIQFDYGEGYWDEWWAMTKSGEGKWISVDEGDVAIEEPAAINSKLPSFNSLKIGKKISFDSIKLTVTELDQCQCSALEGMLPEVINIGEQHKYAHCSGAGNALYTIEYSGHDTYMYRGVWVDPFDITLRSYG